MPTLVALSARSRFDTHVGQPRQQAKVLRELAAGMAYLRESLKSLGVWNDVLIVSYTEFGRRVQDNANNGTDHGTAQVQMLMGAGLRPGQSDVGAARMANKY